MYSKRLILLLILTVNLLRYTVAQSTSYWQQNVDYLIHVTLDDVNHSLQGDIAMKYTNNSPVELNFIYIHLWPNAYKNNQTAFAKQKLESGSIDFYASKEDEKGYIDQLDFKVDGENTKLEADPENIDIAKLILNKPLKSGETIEITTPFHVKIPRCFSRMGHTGQLYQISQWYPKPAVYDKNGWHQIPYLDQGEFFSEFGNFDVFITLPQNYVVGASGDLQTKSEIEFLDSLAASTDASKKISDSKDLSTPPSSPTMKTIEYVIRNAHDFAWFADKRFHVQKSSVTLPESEREVKTYVYYGNKHATEWFKACDYINRSVLFYSDKLGEYPWNVAQAVDGSLEVEGAGGMEYPTITVLSGAYDAQTLDDVITHEVGHNWLYGILGFNERLYPWMDEGINTYYENRYLDTYYDNRTLFGIPAVVGKAAGIESGSPDDLLYAVNSALANQNKSQPVQLPAVKYTPANYGLVVYAQTGYDFRYLEDVLGTDQFDKIMRKFYRDWKFKHPQPYDIKATFERETGEDFGWFFDKLIREERGPDYRISKLQKGKTAMAVDIKNNSDIPASFSISIMDEDSVLRRDWFRGFTGSQTIYLNYKPDWHVTHIKIDAQRTIPETNRENNTIKTSGIFKTLEPLQISPFFSAENPDKTNINYFPIVGWNDHDHWMPGLGIWNSTVPEPLIEYVLAPMYSFSAKTITGQGSLGLNIYPGHGFFSRVRISENVKRYSADDLHVITPDDALDTLYQFTKLESRAEFDLRKFPFASKISQSFMLRYLHINESIATYDFDDLGQIIPMSDNYSLYEISYHLKNKNLLYPHELNVTFQGVTQFTKLYADFKIKINYPKSKNGLDVRLFTGVWIRQPDIAEYGFTLAGGSGIYDYAYDQMLLGRNDNDGLLARQIYEQDGFFKVPAFSGDFTSDIFLGALNFEAPIPKTPLALFADLGYISNSDSLNVIDPFQYDGGVMVRMPNDIFEFYFPLFMSKQLDEQFADGTKYADKITFMLNINVLNVFELMRKLEF